MNDAKVPLSITHPALCKEWSERNAPYTPDQFCAGSHDRVWWKGPCGHEWEAVINHRTSHHTGCPYCTSKRVLKGFNDLQTRKPELVKEWSERNLPLTPDQIMPFSRKKLWWKCENGHEWQATANSRSKGNNCPICHNKRVIQGINDMASRYPQLTAEWSERNGEFQLNEMLSRDRTVPVWWKCRACGREYMAAVRSKLEKDHVCPFCSGRILERGFNDLQTTHPELAAEWDHEKNDDLTPDGTTRLSRRYVWWKCRNGHSWGGKIAERTINGQDCYICRAEFRAVLPAWLLSDYALANGLSVKAPAEIGDMIFALFIPELGLAADLGVVSEDGRILREEKRKNTEEKGLCYISLPICNDREQQANAVREALAQCGVTVYSDIQEDIQRLEISFSRLRNEICHESETEERADNMDDELKKLLLKAILADEQATEAGSNMTERKKKKLAPEPVSGIDYDPDEKPKKTRDPRVKQLMQDDLQYARSDMYGTHESNLKRLQEVPIWEKYALTVNEASQYFHLGTKKLRQIINTDRYAPYLIWNGGRVFIKRKMFEEYLNREIQL